MELIHLAPGEDHVERLAHENDPVRAVLELIWNSLDADATHVEVDLVRNEAGGVTGVVVTDDGHGMNPTGVRDDFRWIGNSWKRRSRRSRGEGRPLHGRAGQGRLRAFALGTQVRWTSTSTDDTGTLVESTVSGTSSRRGAFEVEERPVTSGSPGTRVEASGREGLDRLESRSARATITAALAPYLMAQGHVEVVHDGRRLVVADTIERDETIDLVWEHEGRSERATLRIIEWGVRHRSVHLCDDEGVAIDDLETPVAPEFSFSAYVLWDGMPAHAGQWMLVDLGATDSSLAQLLRLVDEHLEDYFEGRRAEGGREQLEEWRRRGTYPFPEPGEDAERERFDAVATSIRRHVPRNPKQQKLVLGLLRATLRQEPDATLTLLDELLELPTEGR